MKVHELLEKLEGINPDREVVMASDSEGNNYSPLADTWMGIYTPESTWNGEMHVEGPLTDDLKTEGYSEEDVRTTEDGQQAIVLCPTN